MAREISSTRNRRQKRGIEPTYVGCSKGVSKMAEWLGYAPKSVTGPNRFPGDVVSPTIAHSIFIFLY